MTARYLITGGAGFLGINLTRFLLARGHAVTTLDIADFGYPDVADRVRVIRGDVRDRATVDRAMADVDVVVHAAAALPLYPREEIFSTDVDGTREVLDSAHTHGVGRVVHISSTAVYGIPDHHPLREDDPLKGVGPVLSLHLRHRDGGLLRLDRQGRAGARFRAAILQQGRARPKLPVVP